MAIIDLVEIKGGLFPKSNKTRITQKNEGKAILREIAGFCAHESAIGKTKH